ncbi:hypothetical protein A2480_03505 [Candidatus Uhrbacteria bacterium RIFOXYC2_FULL_47_19]|uniref:Uncharacterized protein n=1 Tax=Candidatus Uhrbacteria bacterium RIFOXYC2_FULL_47_19 TaxID=1802424 RepID=A0A1F7WBX3_9BACT|nr:MAG: hypothetical protein A2480_03505 [Candidatus Uhrbacteria bacterium RIFOXYC2_FULL_47_19]
MANTIMEIKQNEMSATLRSLGEAGATTDHSDWMRGRGNAALLVQFIDQQRGLSEKNSYETSVELQLTALRRANDEEKWGLTEDDFARLASSAPTWPKGKSAYRSFRIRFGEGDEGVAKTFEAHYARIQHVFGEGRYWRWEHLHSGKVEYNGKPVERLRLLNGNHTHKAVIEWVVVDLDTHRNRESITAVRGSKSLADEILVIAWMFPDMIRAIDYDKLPGLFAAGYEVNVPEYGGEAWQNVVIVLFYRDDCQVDVSTSDHSDDSSDYSVPVFRESPALGT